MIAQRISPTVRDGSTWKRPRSALARTVTGLCSAKARSQLGIVLTGTKALEAKVSGKSQIKPADCAASTLRTASPTKADTHEKAKLNAIRIRMPKRNSNTE